MATKFYFIQKFKGEDILEEEGLELPEIELNNKKYLVMGIDFSNTEYYRDDMSEEAQDKLKELSENSFDSYPLY